MLTSNKIYPGVGAPFSGYIEVSEGVIAQIAPEKPAAGVRILDLGDSIIIPGLIDLHIHGYGGFEVGSVDPCALPSLARCLAQTGTTSFLPTLGAAPVDVIEEIVRGVSSFLNEKQDDCAHSKKMGLPEAHILGLHLEGPFLNPEMKGAMNENHLLSPSPDLMRKWYDLGRGAIKRVTLAPELPGARELVCFLTQRGITAAAGHTTANYDQALGALDWGVTVATHTFNAMRTFHHRNPGILGAVLTDNRVWAEVLCDGIHIHPATALLVIGAKGIDRVYLASDAVSPGGLPAGVYTSLGHQVTVREEGGAYLADGSLAGSTSTLLEGMKNLLHWTGLTLEKILPMATINPAKSAGVSSRKGSLDPGKDADLVVLNDELELVFIMVKGSIVDPLKPVSS